MMQAFILLCDSAQSDIASGKVHMLGANWSVTGPTMYPMAVVVFLRIPWEEADVERSFSLKLVDHHGQPVKLDDGSQIEFAGDIGDLADSNGPNDDLRRFIDLQGSIAINIMPLPLPQGARYSWTFEVEGEEIATTAFVVRNASS